MDLVDKVERTLGAWYGRLPQLPQKLRLWIADNMWWIMLIGAVVMVAGLLSVLGVLLLGTMLLSVFAGVYGHVVGVIVAMLALVWITLYTVDMVLLFMAISPLKAHELRGWRLLFYGFLLGVAVEITYVFVSADVASFIWSMIVTAFGGYVLYQVRDHFAVASEVRPRGAVADAPEFKPASEEAKTKGDA